MVPILFLGCVAPKGEFQTEIKQGYAGKVDNVLLLHARDDFSGELGPKYANQLMEELRRLLAEAGVDVQTLLVPRFDLETEKEYDQIMQDKNVRHVFTYAITSMKRQVGVDALNYDALATSINKTEFTIRFRLIDREADAIVWNGLAFYYAPPAPADLALQLFEQLMEAGLVNRFQAPAGPPQVDVE